MSGETHAALALQSTEYFCESWGSGEAALCRYAPLTRCGGRLWLHPTLAREYSWREITARATRIWSVSGSLWNPHDLRLIYSASLPLRSANPVAGERDLKSAPEPLAFCPSGRGAPYPVKQRRRASRQRLGKGQP